MYERVGEIRLKGEISFPLLMAVNGFRVVAPYSEGELCINVKEEVDNFCNFHCLNSFFSIFDSKLYNFLTL